MAVSFQCDYFCSIVELDLTYSYCVVEKVNKIPADIVLITGDSIDQTVGYLYQELTPLININKPVYMVFGNHEYYYDAPEWEIAFKNMGINVLTNKSIELQNENHAYLLGGADWGAKTTLETFLYIIMYRGGWSG